MMELQVTDEDQILFLQAFSAPTEAYHFLEKYRKNYPPLFLQRNLTYVNNKKWRTKKVKKRLHGKSENLHSIVDKLAERRGSKHFMRLTFSGLYCDDLTIYRHAEIQVIHKQTKDKLTSMIVDINPNDMLKCSSISLSTEALKITSENGELLNIASCALLFKVKIIDKIGQSGYVDHSDSSIDNIIFESELELFDKDKNGLISNGPHDLNFYCD